MFFTKTAKFILIFFIFILLSITLYLFTAYLFTFFPTQDDNITLHNKQKVYILYNEMHSDIVIDIDSLESKFKKNLQDVIQNREGYLAFGWGDRETYINTPTWNEIQLSTTLNALFINTPSVVHIKFYKRVKRFKNLKVIYLSIEQKEQLLKSIEKSFNKKEKSFKGYGKNDFFYPSIYSYNLFKTCNTWTGERLRDANISVSYWTPLSYNIIDSLPKNE